MRNKESQLIGENTETDFPPLPERDRSSSIDEAFQRELDEADIATLAAGLEEGTIDHMDTDHSDTEHDIDDTITLKHAGYASTAMGAGSCASALYCVCMATTCLVAGVTAIQLSLGSAVGADTADNLILGSSANDTSSDDFSLPSFADYTMPEEADIAVGTTGGVMTLLACSYGLASLAAACLTLSACGVGATSHCVDALQAVQDSESGSALTRYCSLPLRKAGCAALLGASGLATTACSLGSLQLITDAISTQIGELVINNVAGPARDLVFDALSSELSANETSSLLSSSSDFDAGDPAFFAPTASLVILGVIGCCIGTAALKSCLVSSAACVTGTSAVTASGVADAVSYVQREEDRRSESSELREEHSIDI